MDLSIVIPCFNEQDNVELLAAGLLPVLAELGRDRSVELLFVDDGSTDRTADLLESTFDSARVIRHRTNRGLGGALRTGFAQAQGDVIVCCDSDSTYSYTLIPQLLDLLEPGVDIVTGSCYHPLGSVENVPAFRIFFSKTASFMYRLLLRWDVHTYTCVFRAYRRRVVETTQFESNDFLSVTELLANAMCMGYAVRELPCTLRVRRYGQSKAKVSRIIRLHLRFQWQLVRRRASSTASQLERTSM